MGGILPRQKSCVELARGLRPVAGLCKRMPTSALGSREPRRAWSACGAPSKPPTPPLEAKNLQFVLDLARLTFRRGKEPTAGQLQFLGQALGATCGVCSGPACQVSREGLRGAGSPLNPRPAPAPPIPPMRSFFGPGVDGRMFGPGSGRACVPGLGPSFHPRTGEGLAGCGLTAGPLPSFSSGCACRPGPVG